MIWHSKAELEEEGPPSRKEMIWPVVGTPIFLVQIAGLSWLLFRGLSGEPLPLSKLLGIYVVRTGPSWQFTAGIALYLVAIAIILLALWGCTLQIQSWLYWRGRAEPAGNQ